MKTKPLTNHLGVQDICRKLKEQLDQLSEVIVVDPSMPEDEKARRKELMSKLQDQLKDLSV